MIHVVYKGLIVDVTGKTTDDIVVSEGFVFIELLQQIFISYPEIEKRFPPGSLGLLINGKPPAVQDILHEGDEVVLMSTISSASVS